MKNIPFFSKMKTRKKKRKLMKKTLIKQMKKQRKRKTWNTGDRKRKRKEPTMCVKLGSISWWKFDVLKSVNRILYPTRPKKHGTSKEGGRKKLKNNSGSSAHTHLVPRTPETRNAFNNHGCNNWNGHRYISCAIEASKTKLSRRTENGTWLRTPLRCRTRPAAESVEKMHPNNLSPWPRARRYDDETPSKKMSDPKHR